MHCLVTALVYIIKEYEEKKEDPTLCCHPLQFSCEV